MTKQSKSKQFVLPPQSYRPSYNNQTRLVRQLGKKKKCKKKNAQTSSTFYHGLLFFHCEAKMLFSHASIESADAREEKKEIYVCQRQYSGRHYFARSCLRESFSSFFFFFEGIYNPQRCRHASKGKLSSAQKKKKKCKIKKKKKKKKKKKETRK